MTASLQDWGLLASVQAACPGCGVEAAAQAHLLTCLSSPLPTRQVEREREQMEQGEAVPASVQEPAKRAKHNVVGVGKSSGRGDWKQVGRVRCGRSASSGSLGGVDAAAWLLLARSGSAAEPVLNTPQLHRCRHTLTHPVSPHLGPPLHLKTAWRACGQPAQPQAVHQLGEEDEGQSGGGGIQGRQARGGSGDHARQCGHRQAHAEEQEAAQAAQNGRRVAPILLACCGPQVPVLC